MKNVLMRIGANWLFMIAVVLLYFILGLWNFQAVIASLETFLGLLKRILPILVLVFALIYLSNLFLNPKVVSRYLGEGTKRRGGLSPSSPVFFPPAQYTFGILC